MKSDCQGVRIGNVSMSPGIVMVKSVYLCKDYTKYCITTRNIMECNHTLLNNTILLTL